jgi:hypothetical protein
VTHYEVLGVARTAPSAEIRRAYLRLARAHHPDFHTAGGPGEQAAAERRMRDVNEAWRVLSDAELRRRYDGWSRAPNSPSPGWVPPDDGDDWDPSMLDDTPINGVKPRAALTFAPAGFFGAGVALLLVGMVASLPAAMAFGVMAVVLSGVLFVVVPFMTMAESRRRDLEG